MCNYYVIFFKLCILHLHLLYLQIEMRDAKLDILNIMNCVFFLCSNQKHNYQILRVSTPMKILLYRQMEMGNTLDNFEPCIFSLLKLSLLIRTYKNQILQEKNARVKCLNLIFLDLASRIFIYYIDRWRCGTLNKIVSSDEYIGQF